jgi:translocation and assembly module TamB
MRSGDGRLEFQGEIDARSAGGPGIDLQINGQDFQAAKLPEALVDLSPELRLQGTGPYHLSGTLKIPRAKIELRELPKSTVVVSDDEIVLGDQDAEEPQRAPTNLTAKVRVELGDDVSFSGFGLVTGLTGILDAGTDSGGATVDGSIELRDARYQAYGQDLTVERGRLLFAGSPTNPDLDVLAARESRDGEVKAFLSVTGPASKPVSRVYSEPALPDAEALAYLLTGNGLNQASAGAGADIASAALALGMSKGDPLLQDLGDRLGLDEISVESGTEGVESSALLVGKYLNPDL